MGVQELINDIRRGKYEYETMLYTNATYTFLDKNNKIVKEIPNPIIMKDFFRKPVKIHLSEDNTKLINELGGELYLNDDRIEYKDGQLLVFDVFTHELMSGDILSKTTDNGILVENNINYEKIIKDLRDYERKHVC